MPTKYDVFAEVIEKAPCTESELNFRTSVTKQLEELQKVKWVKRIGKIYTPIKSNATTQALAIITYCLKNNLNHNHFFSKNIPLIITQLYEHTPNRRPEKLKGNKDILDLLKYFEKNQFILVSQKRPARGSILKHKLLTHIATLFELPIKAPGFIPLVKKEIIQTLKPVIINPFETSVFSFLAGSAQLEGSTVSDGETRDIILNDIYPNKPQKDIQMVKNLNEALHYMIKNLDEQITPEHIKQINKAIMFSLHRNAGEYKKSENKIQGNPHFKTIHASQVPLAMIEFCKTLNTFTEKEQILQNIGFMHNELQRIHPFADGNSRTTRMVVNWILAKNHLPLLVFRMGSFDEYMSLTKMSLKRDDVKLTQFMWAVLWHEELMNK